MPTAIKTIRRYDSRISVAAARMTAGPATVPTDVLRAIANDPDAPRDLVAKVTKELMRRDEPVTIDARDRARLSAMRRTANDTTIRHDGNVSTFPTLRAEEARDLLARKAGQEPPRRSEMRTEPATRDGQRLAAMLPRSGGQVVHDGKRSEFGVMTQEQAREHLAKKASR